MRRDGPIRVLIVDDADPFARALAAELNRCADFHALTSTGGLDQLRALLVRYHPEFILLDLALRTHNALELLAELRQYYPVPIIVSARNNAASAPRAAAALQGGALEVVCRPSSSRSDTLRPYAVDLLSVHRPGALLSEIGCARATWEFGWCSHHSCLSQRQFGLQISLIVHLSYPQIFG